MKTSRSNGARRTWWLGFAAAALGAAVVAAIVVAEHPQEQAIAFLRKGQVWFADAKGGHARRITRTEGRVLDFLVSPGLHYLAYGARTGRSAGSDDGALTIVDLASGKTLRTFDFGINDRLFPAVWTSTNALIFYEGLHFAIGNYFRFDVATGTKQRLDPNVGSRLVAGDHFAGGYLYVDDSGLGPKFREHLHLVDARSKDDHIVASRHSILAPRTSPDRARIAFIEVQSGTSKPTDTVWVLTLADGSLRELYRRPVGAAIGRHILSWSPDGRYVGVFIQPHGVVLRVDDPSERHEVSGLSPQWLSNGLVAFERSGSLFTYDPSSRREAQWIADATEHQAL